MSSETIQAVTTVDIGGIQYGALQRQEEPVLTVAWRSRVSPPGRWFTCGQLVPQGGTYAVRGWDGAQIGTVCEIGDGVEEVRRYYARMASAAGSVGMAG